MKEKVMKFDRHEVDVKAFSHRVNVEQEGLR